MEPNQLSHLEDNFFKLIRNTNISFRFLQIFENYSLLDEFTCTKLLATEGMVDRAYLFYKLLINKEERPSSFTSITATPTVPRNPYEVLLQALKSTNQTEVIEIAQLLNPPKHDPFEMIETGQTFEVLWKLGIMHPSKTDWIPGDGIAKLAIDSYGDAPEVVEAKIGAIRWLLCLDKRFHTREENNCTRVHLDILKFLMSQGQDLGRLLFQTVNYLTRAEFHELLLHVKDNGLTKYIEKLQKKDEDGATILHRAVKVMDLTKETSQLILELGGFTINEPGTFGETVLHYAARGGKSRSQIAMLVELGADWKAKNVDEETAIHSAVRSGNFDCLEYLLVEMGADPNATNRNGFTPLLLALTNSTGPDPLTHKIVETLLNAKADAHALDENGNSLKELAESCYRQGLIEERTVELFEEPVPEPEPEKPQTPTTFFGSWGRFDQFL